ncbi:phosphate acyltransferase [Candidatus Gracilibacteria bacterium]|nr:phosphate acyltransferase [Candidatus Gracilibacteria bacterium]
MKDSNYWTLIFSVYTQVISSKILLVMNLTQLLKNLSKKNKTHKIIYPDIADNRVFEVVSQLRDMGENPVICGKADELKAYRELIDNGLEYYEVPASEKNEVFAAQKLKSGEIDGFLGGNITTTSGIVRALIKNVGSAQGVKRLSSHFIFGKEQGEIFLFSDGGIQIDPNATELAEIGFLTIESALKYGMTPRVAMLSFSTTGSGGEHTKVLKIREATKLLRQKLLDEGLGDIPLEGEIQFDAAFIPEIGLRKNPKTTLTKPANVFIFPDIDSGNIAYKITERLGGAVALGPTLQGLAKPANDLSRGCSVEDIIAMHHITKNQ